MLLDNPSALRGHYARALFEDVIPFWMRHSPDPEYGGYLTCLERDGRVFSDAKNVWLQGRQVWMLSKLYRAAEPRPDYLDLAASGARFLAQHGRDENGDWFLLLDRKGRPLDARRDIFSACFAALGLGEYSRASGESWAADLAVQTFHRVQEVVASGRAPLNELAPQDPSLLSLSLPMIQVNLAAELAQAVPGCPLGSVLRDAMHLILTRFLDRETGLIYERVAPDGGHPDSPDGRLITPGHGIESAWFIMAAAEQLQDRAAVELAADALEGQLSFGWDPAHGGIFTFLDARRREPVPPEGDRKVWWSHTEALVALLLAWRLTRRASFARWYERLHEYTWSHFPDPRHGEWFAVLDRQGEVVDSRKGYEYKGCFHVPRALWWCLRTLDQIIQAGQA